MHLILTGATGLVGSACLHHMLSEKAITKVSILSRRPVPMAEGHSQVNVILQRDLSTFTPETLEKLKGAEGCVWALGVTITDVSREEYDKITVDYPLTAAKAFSSLSDPFKFVYVSGEGATTSPGRFTPAYGSIKGHAESELLQLMTTTPSLRPFSLRPGFVDAWCHPQIQPYIPPLQSWTKKLALYGLGPVIRVAWKANVSPTEELGKVLVELAMGDGEKLSGEGVIDGGRTVTNKGFRRLAGL